MSDFNNLYNLASDNQEEQVFQISRKKRNLRISSCMQAVILKSYNSVLRL